MALHATDARPRWGGARPAHNRSRFVTRGGSGARVRTLKADNTRDGGVVMWPAKMSGVRIDHAPTDQNYGRKPRPIMTRTKPLPRERQTFV